MGACARRGRGETRPAKREVLRHGAALEARAEAIRSLRPARRRRGGRSPSHEGWEIHPAIAPAEGEPVVRKRASDSFYETTLRADLEARGVRHLVVVGCRTQYCVDTTCRSATAHGFDVTLAADAHTTAADVLTSRNVAHHTRPSTTSARRHVIQSGSARSILILDFSCGFWSCCQLTMDDDNRPRHPIIR